LDKIAMFNRLTLINILLVIALFFLTKETMQIWVHAPEKTGSSSNKKTIQKAGQPPLVRRASPPKNSFRVISEKNLFHPQRKWGEGVKKEEQNQRLFSGKTPSKEIILYGILIFGDHKIAVLGDRKAPAKDKGIKKVGVGDSFDGFQVEEISANMVILKNEDESETIQLYKHKEARQITPSRPVTRRPTPAPRPPRTPKKPKSSPKKSLPKIFRGALDRQR
jgi:hypothetical protein